MTRWLMPFMGGTRITPEGGFDPTTSPLFGAYRAAQEQQLATARDELMSSLPSGGALQRGLSDVGIQGALDRARALGDISALEDTKAFTLGAQSAPQPTYLPTTPYTPPSYGQSVAGVLGGASSAAANTVAAEQVAAQQNAAALGKKGDLGLGAGMLFGGKGTGGAALALGPVVVSGLRLLPHPCFHRRLSCLKD
jgi:hypothetical protein